MAYFFYKTFNRVKYYSPTHKKKKKTTHHRLQYQWHPIASRAIQSVTGCIAPQTSYFNNRPLPGVPPFQKLIFHFFFFKLSPFTVPGAFLYPLSFYCVTVDSHALSANPFSFRFHQPVCRHPPSVHRPHQWQSVEKYLYKSPPNPFIQYWAINLQRFRLSITSNQLWGVGF